MSSFQMRPHPRNNVLEVYAERDSIQLDPVYQRISWVWDRRKQQLFIDSIINGFDLPKIYFHELMPPRNTDGSLFRYAIIDGKQRLEAIWSFMDEEFGLASDFRFFDDPELDASAAKYSTLATEFPHLRARFDKTDLPIVTIQTDDEELIENLFSRLNEAVPLTAPEYRNTLGGPMPRAIREVEDHDFFQTCLPFETGRYKYLDLSAKFLHITKEQRFVSTKKLDLDRLVRTFKKGREDSQQWASPQAVDELTAATRSTLDPMYDFFRQKDPLLGSIGWVTLYFHIFRLFGGAEPPSRLGVELFSEFVNDVTETRNAIRAVTGGAAQTTSAHDPSLARFDSLRQSPNDAGALRTRYSILRQYLIERFKVKLPTPDPVEAG